MLKPYVLNSAQAPVLCRYRLNYLCHTLQGYQSEPEETSMLKRRVNDHICFVLEFPPDLFS